MVTDKSGGISNERFEIVVSGVNDAPSISGLVEKVEIVEDGSKVVTFRVLDEETSKDNLTVEVKSLLDRIETPTYHYLGEGRYEVTITLNENETRVGRLEVSVTDEEKTKISKSVDISIVAENDLPVIVRGLSETMKSGDQYESELVVSDVEVARGEDEQELSVSIIKQTPGPGLEKEVPLFRVEQVDSKWMVRSNVIDIAGSYEVVMGVSDTREETVATYTILVSDTLVSPSLVTETLKRATEDSLYSVDIVVTDNVISSVQLSSIEKLSLIHI